MWSGLPCSPSGDLPNPRIKLESLVSPALTRQVLSNSKARVSYHLFESLNFFEKCFIVFNVAVLYFFIKFI